MAATTLIVKMNFGTEIRRYTAQGDYLTWPKLSRRASELFELSNKTFKMTYTDDEGDRITISSDAEVSEAVGLALKLSPAVLRLTVVPTDAKSTPRCSSPKAAEGGQVPSTDGATAHATPGVDAPSLAMFLDTLAKQLPAAVAQMPEGVRRLLPQAELDIAATVAANAAANASCIAAEAKKVAEAAAASCPFAQTYAMPPSAAPPAPGVHVGVTCDKTGMCPIVGNRYHLVGHNYDLCEAEYLKLSEAEKAGFTCIPSPPAPAPAIPIGVHATATAGARDGCHPGVVCDKSGMSPIVGMRYHLRGANYDLCQAEYDKLPAHDKLQFVAIPPPTETSSAWAEARGRGGPWGCRGWGGGPRGHHAMANAGNGPGCGGGPKLAARFVRDVSIFDGTQMPPGTAFTKIWRLKNVGEVPWPPGTKMLFVGGDAMSPTEMAVPLSRAGPVMPGEEVDVAVEMVAPKELGRYLGYWRLVGPLGRRKFGQRVWCHIQVVDEAAAEAVPTMADEELQRTAAEIAAEIASKKSAITSADGPDDDDDDDDDADMGNADPVAAAPSADTPLSGESMAVEAPLPGLAEDAAEGGGEPAANDDAGNKSDDDVVLVDREGASEPTAPSTSGAPLDAIGQVRTHLASMGFDDEVTVEAALKKHGADVEACARSLAAVTEWESLLDDLAEMGFQDRALNKALMLKHAGNIKRTVKELVEDA